MTIHGPADGWVVAPDGRKFWGRAGAAGLLVVDERDRVLLQHRVEWSHFGGTWGIPGGARQFDESAVDGALRESAEEAAVPPEALRLVFTSVVDLDVWTYTTVVARATRAFEPVISDGESEALTWVPWHEVDSLPLHPGFAATWPRLGRTLREPLHLVVDAANVVGSRPDGWWRDRAGATDRLASSLGRLAETGVRASDFGRPGDEVETWWPEVTLVVEGKATAAQEPPLASRLDLRRAEADGDQAIVDHVRALGGAPSGPGPLVTVVTADRGLASRVEALGARVVGPRILLESLDGLGA
ncbi:Putative 8-oxo-dGTP diphosphatase 3 [Frondihabitans sp. 762G35]|uniref:NUDIX domain-containing protein n=1 Tax=Frondihabitans sp. 762G35 TaxID=1446794 RepID=UPI000D2039D4|nr:NUDIX domain-containing protein [Frondihabitans sp. 762G35]ARC56733.1 Putative 8-oxo-dGTP diphosphatase 3 [Frondihabitans sp. 762G35]